MSEFQDKVVIITGASSGIGAATAIEYSKHGARLVLAGRNEERLQKTVEDCQQQGLSHEKILSVSGDLEIEADCNRLVDQAIEKFGQIDILINNAGLACFGTFMQCTIADVDYIHSNLVRSMYMVSKQAVPHLIKTKGSVVNMSGATGIKPLQGTIAMGMAKAAIVALSTKMAQEFASEGVNVNCIVPGIIKTYLFSRPDGPFKDSPADEEFYEKMAALHPLQCVGSAEEVASTIVFLTSKAASFITGCVLPIDGGLHGAGPVLF